jgi:hypothetical protein
MTRLASRDISPIKVGLIGHRGSGLTTTGALLSLALAKEIHGGAPVHVSDPQMEWQFMELSAFRREGVPLFSSTGHTFESMLASLDIAERDGACVWVAELRKAAIDLTRAARRRSEAASALEFSLMWADFVLRVLRSPLHCILIGDICHLTDLDVRGIGNESHLVLEMTCERKSRVKKGERLEDEGRMWHHACVINDRSWAIQGRMFRWSDKVTYKPGCYRTVWKDLRPHFEASQKKWRSSSEGPKREAA